MVLRGQETTGKLQSFFKYHFTAFIHKYQTIIFSLFFVVVFASLVSASLLDVSMR
jgi:predicted RND superfamily exporter protein